MSDRLRIALATFNPIVGDLDHNFSEIARLREEARAGGADLVVTCELSATGYPLDDLVLRPAFQDAVRDRVAAFAAGVKGDGGPAVILGAPWREGDTLHNAAILIDDGRIAPRLKQRLPDYGVFDESRVFAPGGPVAPVDCRGARLGLMTCEDMWYADTSRELAAAGAEILIAPHASPWRENVLALRERHAAARARENGLPLMLVNLLGGQDELVFEGDAFALDREGALRARGARWSGGVLYTDWTRGEGGWTCAPGESGAAEDKMADAYAALVCGLRDYVEKNGFSGVVLGLSGGIDSALVAALAVDAIGAARVTCLMMPSKYTSAESLEDAADCARRLGVRLETISIETAVAAFEGMLAPHFAGSPADATEENIQSRIRGLTLMAWSNKFGPMVLATGNKSEYATGYATLYGDMCGGYAPLKDAYKTMVFALSEWRNANKPDIARGPAGAVMPERIIAKPPSAELKPDQRDEDTLPPYDALDAILSRLIEEEASLAEIVGEGYDHALVARVAQMLKRAEYKRFQAAPGPKITARAFGRDRRYPLTNGFTEK
ncbi:MAG: NAD+ synthase [Parvularculaceae bacterium]